MSAFFPKADVKKHPCRLSLNVCFRPEADAGKIEEKVKVNSRIEIAGEAQASGKTSNRRSRVDCKRSDLWRPAAYSVR